MSARKFGASWWADFTCQRKRYRIKSPENTHAGAKNFENLARQRLARGEPITGLPEPVSITFADFAKDWMERYVKVNNKPSEQRAKECVLRCHLVPAFGKRSLPQIDAAGIEEYKAYGVRSGLCAKSINNHLAILRKCLRSAYEWGHTDGVPFIKPLRVEPKEVAFLNEEECSALLGAVCGEPGHSMILAALHTGMRLGELMALEWSSVDFQRASLAVSRSVVRGFVTSPKSNRIRHLPLTSTLVSALQKRRGTSGLVFTRPGGAPLSDRVASGILHRACRTAGLPLFGWHRLRHTFASQLVSKGVSMRTVQKLLGHSTIMMTERYAHLAPELLADAIRVLESSDRPSWATGGQRDVSSAQLRPHADVRFAANIQQNPFID